MSRRRDPGPPRFWCVDKPAGPTSFDVVRAARRASGYRRVGHAGTLDPFATGVLVLGLGAATRLLTEIEAATKVYRAQVRFGEETATEDPTGEVVRRAPVDFSERELRQALHGFVGEIEQVPPRFSAVHVQGQRAYRLAREGRDFDLPARRVRVDSLELQAFDPPEATLRMRCGKGTYVRSLVRDLARVLGSAAHLVALRREAVGHFRVEEAADGAQLQQAWEEGTGVSGPEILLRDWPHLRLDPDAVYEVRHGVQPKPQWWAKAGWSTLPPRVGLVDEEDRLVAVAGGREDGRLVLLTVLPEA